MAEELVNKANIDRVAGVIGLYLRRTPSITVDPADFGLPGASLSLKLELFQYAGSFKTRGAFANLLTRPIPAAGVVAASGGNHGAAVAFAARRLGVHAQIFVPSVSSPVKIERIRQYGAALSVVGDSYAEALAASEEWASTTGALGLHAFDQVETILGQGTIAREVEEDAPGLDTVLVPVGGGGLISGIATWFERSVRVVGVEPEAAPSLTNALAAGHPVDAPAGGIAADSLAPSRIGAITFALSQKFVEGTVLVSDDAIQAAQVVLWEGLRVVAEPGGAAALAALLSGRYVPGAGERVAVIVSGGNTTAVDFARH